jgi:hypothetical protein
VCELVSELKVDRSWFERVNVKALSDEVRRKIPHTIHSYSKHAIPTHLLTQLSILTIVKPFKRLLFTKLVQRLELRITLREKYYYNCYIPIESYP